MQLTNDHIAMLQSMGIRLQAKAPVVRGAMGLALSGTQAVQGNSQSCGVPRKTQLMN
jgi:hypothetical protein